MRGRVRACERSTDDDLARLREIDARIRAGHYGKDRYSEFAAFVNDNQRFHETLLDAARNPELRRAFDSLNYEARIARRTRGRGVPDLEPDLRRARRDHRGAGRARRRALVAAVAGHARESHQPPGRRPPAQLALGLGCEAGATPARPATPRPRPRARGALARQREAAVQLQGLAVERLGGLAARASARAPRAPRASSARRAACPRGDALGVAVESCRPAARRRSRWRRIRSRRSRSPPRAAASAAAHRRRRRAPSRGSAASSGAG